VLIELKYTYSNHLIKFYKQSIFFLSSTYHELKHHNHHCHYDQLHHHDNHQQKQHHHHYIIIIKCNPLIYVLRGDDMEYWMIERVRASKANRNRPSLENLTIGTLEEVPGREINKLCMKH